MLRVHLAAAVLLVALAALVAPAGAAAAGARASTSHAALARAQSIAFAYWNATPCKGRLRITSRQDKPAEVADGAHAWATFTSALGANNLAAPAAGYGACTIALARERWPTAASFVTDWDLLCMTMIHEVGHLLGHAHQDSSPNIMNTVFTSYAAEPEACRSSRPVLGGRRR